MQGVVYSENLRKSVNRFWLFSVNVTVNRSPGGVAKRRERTVSLKPDRKTADKTAKINSDGRASRIQRDRTRRVLLEFRKTAQIK